jgi:hypothetical protein
MQREGLVKLKLVDANGLDQVLPGRTSSGRAGTLTFPELFRLPVAVGLPTAARAIGVHVNTAYRMIAEGRFPSPVMRPGWRYVVPTLPLMRALGIDSIPVYGEDVEAGADWASRAA